MAGCNKVQYIHFTSKFAHCLLITMHFKYYVQCCLCLNAKMFESTRALKIEDVSLHTR